MEKSKKPVRKGARKETPGGPDTDGLVMEHQLTNQLRDIKFHQAFSEDLDHLYATDMMAIGSKELSGYQQPILIQLTKSIGLRSKIGAWLKKSAHGPTGTRLYVEMKGGVNRKMAQAVKDACFAIWTGQKGNKKFLGITVDSEGNSEWWSPRESVRKTRERNKRR